MGIDHERAGHWVDGVATCQYWHGGCAWGFARTNRQRCDELKLRQQAKIDDNERIAIALEGAELGFWEWDIATDSFRLSARSLAMFGFTSDDEKIGATHAAWQARIHPEDLPVILAKVRAYQKTRRSDWSASTAFVIDPAFRFGFWIAADGWVTRAGN